MKKRWVLDFLTLLLTQLPSWDGQSGAHAPICRVELGRRGKGDIAIAR